MRRGRLPSLLILGHWNYLSKPPYGRPRVAKRKERRALYPVLNSSSGDSEAHELRRNVPLFFRGPKESFLAFNRRGARMSARQVSGALPT
jgi:hypothetical protein